MGIASSHNGAVCLLKGQDIAVAIQEERLTRHKRSSHPGQSATLSIKYCLETVGITPSDLSAIVLCVAHPSSGYWEDLALNQFLRPSHNNIPIFKITHHLGHAIAAYASSGFDNSVVLVVDSYGSPWGELSEEERNACDSFTKANAERADPFSYRENISIYRAVDNEIAVRYKLLSRFDDLEIRKVGMPLFGSLGDMYGAAGKKIFGSFLEGPGKVMGLAPYGKPVHPVEDFVEFVNGRIVYKSTIPDMYRDSRSWPADFDRQANLAASVQQALECALRRLVYMTRDLAEGSHNLCYAGGVALNSVANEKLLEISPFANHFFMPAAEDSGSAIGAAFWGLWKLTGQLRAKKQQVIDSHGRSYNRSECNAALYSVPGLLAETPEHLADTSAQFLASGRILGCFQGGAELGPRALGWRSILCDPRNAEMKDLLNARVKFREGFRPFAPVILEEHVAEWFETKSGQERSPFMLRVMKFRSDKRNSVPAVVHVDGTGRVQTVGKDGPPMLRAILERFYEATGVPILLNTSLNVAGEPIVETPEDALWCLCCSGLDAVILESLVVTKSRTFDLWQLTPRLRALQISIVHDITDGTLRENLATADLINDTNASSQTDGLGSYIKSGAFDQQGLYDMVRLQHLVWKRARIIDGESPNPVHIRMITATPWGLMATAASSDVFPFLRLCNGKRTLRNICDLMLAEGSSQPENTFLSTMSSLKRAGAISFS